MLTLTPTKARIGLFKRLASNEPTRIVGLDGKVSYLIPEKLVEEKNLIKNKGSR